MIMLLKISVTAQVGSKHLGAPRKECDLGDVGVDSWKEVMPSSRLEGK